MKPLSIADATEVVTRQAQALGVGWKASSGTARAWGLEQYPFVELADGRSTSITIWVNGSEAILSATVNSDFEEANLEIWGLKVATVESIVGALARGQYETSERYVHVHIGRKRVRLLKWPPGAQVPGFA